MSTWKERVAEEKNELDGKLAALGVFMGKPEYRELNPMQRNLLVVQRETMCRYSNVLAERLSHALAEGLEG